MKKEPVSNYRVFFNQFEKKWNLSNYWANKLKIAQNEN